MPYYKNFSHGSLVVTDGTGSPLSHTVDVDDGTLQISDIVPGLRESSDYERKGAWVSSAFTTRKYPTVTISCNFAKFRDTSSGTFYDMLFGTTGTPYAAAVSTVAPSGAAADKVPMAFTLALTIEGTNFGDSEDHTATFAKCRIESFSFSEGDPSKVALTFKVLGAITGHIPTAEW